MVQYQLYGTHLTYRVEGIITSANKPLTVKEVALLIAELPDSLQVNLKRRVRFSLNMLTSQGRVVRGTVLVENIISFTYSSVQNESTKQA